MSGYSIFWEDLLEGYNRIYGTKHDTVKSLVLAMYDEHKGLTKCSDILGVSRPTFRRKLESFGKKIQERGGDNHVGIKKKTFLAISPERMATMTRLQIAEECGFASVSYVSTLVKNYNRKMKKVLNNGRYYARL